MFSPSEARTSGRAVAMWSNWARSTQSAREGCRATTRKRRGCRWIKSIAPVTVPGPNVKLLRQISSTVSCPVLHVISSGYHLL